VLVDAILEGTNFTRANLVGSKLQRSSLQDADLTEANLTSANFFRADFFDAKLCNANLSRARLIGTLFRGTELGGVDFTGAILGETVFSGIDLSRTIGLDVCEHLGPSAVDLRTLRKSGTLPLSFLRGVGLPDILIDYLPAIFNRAILHYSCFISYSTKEQAFSDRLYADLQNEGVRCWFAPHDMPIGGKIHDEIDAALTLRDKVLLILSEHSIKSDWVEDEVTKAFEEERKRGQTVLFPIRVDDAVMDTNEAWAAKLRARHIGDFRRWKEHDEYQKSFARVLRDLTVKKP
jgi:hypothetical protein